MATHSQLLVLANVSDLAVQSSLLRTEVGELDKDWVLIDRRFQTDKRALNKLLNRVLPSAIGVLLLENPPVRITLSLFLSLSLSPFFHYSCCSCNCRLDILRLLINESP